MHPFEVESRRDIAAGEQILVHYGQDYCEFWVLIGPMPSFASLSLSLSLSLSQQLTRSPTCLLHAVDRPWYVSRLGDVS